MQIIKDFRKLGFLWRFSLTLLLLVGVTGLFIEWSDVEFGRVDYWNNRGVFFLFFVTVFPRLTLLLSSVASGGIIWWLGWLICPRYLVAWLATLAYWHENPLLVTMAWVVAIGGEATEKTMMRQRFVHVQQQRGSGEKPVTIIDV